MLAQSSVNTASTSIPTTNPTTLGHIGTLPYLVRADSWSSEPPPRVSAVVPLCLLLGSDDDPPAEKPSWSDLALAALRSVGGHAAESSAAIPVSEDRECQFRIDPIPSIFRLKLAALADHWKAEVKYPDDNSAVYRIPTEPGFFAGLVGRKCGIEVVVRADFAGALAEVSACVYGRPPRRFHELATTALPQLVGQARSFLEARLDRRTSGRVPADIQVWAFPVSADGEVMSPVMGRCLDLSAGGVGFMTETSLPSRYAYLVILSEPDAKPEWAILVHLVRSEETEQGMRFGGHYATWG